MAPGHVQSPDETISDIAIYASESLAQSTFKPEYRFEKPYKTTVQHKPLNISRDLARE